MLGRPAFSANVHDQGNLLLAAIAPRFDSGGGGMTLRKLCKIMSKHQQLKKLSTTILNNYSTSCWPWIVTRAMFLSFIVLNVILIHQLQLHEHNIYIAPSISGITLMIVNDYPI